jgi:hypothetical protein
MEGFVLVCFCDGLFINVGPKAYPEMMGDERTDSGVVRRSFKKLCTISVPPPYLSFSELLF